VWDGIAVDITERVRAAEAVRASEESLRDANRRKDDFLAMLAHELRNPLGPIRNSLHILRLRGTDARTVDTVREMMDRQMLHLTRMVDDLLDVSRITRGKIILRSERLDWGRFVHMGCEDRRREFESMDIKLNLEAPPTPVWVNGDPTRLAQILDNLLANALKFTKAGGEVSVDISVDEETQAALLTVRDTGVGIDQDMLPQLFGAFMQAEQSLDRSQGGLGLGLAIVKGMAELHGGEVSAESDGPGRGATFTVRLPLAQPAVDSADASLETTPSVRRLRVLVVEDNVDAADSLRLLLEMSGHEVNVAHTGPEGVKIASQFEPQVVLCDLGLPGMDGFTVASQLRNQSATRAARLIAVTGYGRDEDRRRAKEAGFDEHLTKPVDPRKLLEELAKG
jgi:CheY-like chemotaxis protein/nitrogen-specific signal transduction histidine kinase